MYQLSFVINSLIHLLHPYYVWRLPGGSDGKESACNAGDLGLIPGSGRSPGGGHGTPLQYSCLENPHGQKSLVGYSPWGHKESDTTEWLTHTHIVFGVLCYRLGEQRWCPLFSLWGRSRVSSWEWGKGREIGILRKIKAFGTAAPGTGNRKYLGHVKGVLSSMEGPAEVVLVPTGTGSWFLRHHLQPGSRSGEKQMVGINWSWGLLGGGVVGGPSQSVTLTSHWLFCLPGGCSPDLEERHSLTAVPSSPQESALVSIKLPSMGYSTHCA